ncbi:MAG: flavin reductase family protein [archaeon]|nr:flavin reductase family protein [archaeon]
MKTQINKKITPIVSPAVVISVGEEEEANLITLAWVARVVSDPPIMSISIRPSRHSYSLIEKLEEFVINVPSQDQIHEMDFCGTRSGKKVNKWEELNLSKEKASNVKVPLIKEFPINIECTVVNRIEHGTHIIYLGEVQAVQVDEKLLKDGKIDPLEMSQIVYVSGNYYGLNNKSIKKHGFSVKS